MGHEPDHPGKLNDPNIEIPRVPGKEGSREADKLERGVGHEPDHPGGLNDPKIEIPRVPEAVGSREAGEQNRGVGQESDHSGDNMVPEVVTRFGRVSRPVERMGMS